MAHSRHYTHLFSNFSSLQILITILFLSGCATFGLHDDEEQKQAEILNTQKSLIISFLNKGLPGIAAKELRVQLKKYPDDPDFKNLMGLTQLALKNPKRAVVFFRDALRRKRQPSIALNLSSAYIESGQYQKAVRTLLDIRKSEEMEDYPHPERISHNLGLAAERSKKLRRAERYYRRALNDNPRFYISIMRLGQLYDKTKRPKSARREYKKARAICGFCFDPVNAMTMNYVANGQTRQAMRTLKKWLALKNISAKDRKRGKKLLKLVQRVGTKTPRAR